MLNRVTLIGNLGRDPEVRRLENGTPVAKFPIATNESYKDNNGEWQTLTEWHDVVLWRNNAEIAEKFFKKGTLVFVEGKITHRKYTDKTGIERYATEIVANTCRAFEKRESNNSNFPSQESPYTTSRPAVYPTTNTQTNGTSSESSRPSDFESIPAPEMADAPSIDGVGDLPF
jgi:single-strand DNA-binding protein